MAFFDLLKGVGIVISKNISNTFFSTLGPEDFLRGNRDISTIDDLCPGVERVRLERDIVSTTKTQLA